MFVNYFHTFSRHCKVQASLLCSWLSKKVHTFYTQVIFGCTRHSLNKFGSALVGTKILRSTMPIRIFEFWMLNFELFAATHAIVSWSIVNWSLRQCWVLNCRRSRCWIVQLGILVSCLFMQFVTITQPLFNSLQSHISPTLVVILQLLFLFCRIIRVFDVIFHTFNCRLL